MKKKKFNKKKEVPTAIKLDDLDGTAIKKITFLIFAASLKAHLFLSSCTF